MRPDVPLHVRVIRGKGRGIIAGDRFAEGEVIARNPVLVIPGNEWPLVGDSIISSYSFSWGDADDAEDAAIALGHGSLLNHSYDPNAFAQLRVREKLIEFVALRDIEEGEEVTINYNGDPDAEDRIDFPVRD